MWHKWFLLYRLLILITIRHIFIIGDNIKMSTKEIALLRLFNAVQTESQSEFVFNVNDIFRMIKNGYILDPRIIPNQSLFSVIEDVVGIGGEKLNSSFHKSWGKVANASIFQLIAEQILHYITTYGFENLGVYDERFVYIPAEKLKLPEEYDNIPLVFIKALNAEEILNEIVSLGSSGIALSKQTLSDLMIVVKENNYQQGWVSEIQNREFRTLLMEHYNIVPSEPNAWLRFVITKLTGESLVIKNNYLISKIKSSDYQVLDALLEKTPKSLASIFFRYKPLFLAMKSISRNKTFFNNLRKKANKLHKPLAEDYLNSITGKMKNGEFKIREFRNKISEYPIWRKIRLAYALKNRLSGMESIVYRVRNGKGFATEFSDWFDETQLEKVLNYTLQEIASDISGNIDGKLFYIPSYVNYALPQSEKQFVGNVPANTSVSVDSEDLIVGIHWYNNPKERVDIDFSIIDATGKYGWDAKYRSSDRGILFSGDVTDAPRPNGASEMFYFRNFSKMSDALISANWFNMVRSEGQVENCKIFVAKEKVNGDFEQGRRTLGGYMVNPNNIIFSQNVTIDKKQNSIGLISNKEGETRVYFLMTSVGNSISSSVGKQSELIRDFLLKTSTNVIDLREIIELAGGIILDERSDIPEDVEIVDLSLESLDKTTFVKMFS